MPDQDFALLSLLGSPRINPNLLQRAEVVALINTLHRFSESLHAAEMFQGMWEEEFGTPSVRAFTPFILS